MHSGSRLYEDEPLYRWIPDRSIVVREVDSCPLPEGKDKIMRWLYMTRAMNDDIVDDIHDLVSSCLELGSDFFNMIVESPVLGESMKVPLILSILKYKAIVVANDVLHTYIPETCNVPNV